MDANRSSVRHTSYQGAPIRHFGWVVFGFLSLAIAAIGALVMQWKVPVETQRETAGWLTVRGLDACLVLGFAGACLLLGKVSRIAGRRTMILSLVAFAAGFLVCFLAPRTNRIFFDEHIYMQIGQNICHTGEARLANYARAEYGQYQVMASWVNKQPNGHPYALSLFYRLLGVKPWVSFLENQFFTGLAAFSIFLGISFLPWRLPNHSALLGALLFCLTPLVPFWGHTSAVEPGAAATAAFAFMAACLHARMRDRSTGRGLPATAALLAASLAFASYFRPESLLVFPVAVAVLYSVDRRLLLDPVTWAGFAVGVALVTPDLLHLWSVRTEDWGASDGRRFDFSFVIKNLASNGGYFFDSKWFPLAGTALMFSGVYYFFRYNRTAFLPLFVWFACAWGIFVVFYAGGYYYGASSRYGVVSCAPVAILMGVGAARLGGLLTRSPMFGYGLVAVLSLNWLATFKIVPTVGREASEARADSVFVELAAPLLPEGSLVLSSNPCMWTLAGVNASQIFVNEQMARDNLNELRRQYPGGIYLHWNFWHGAEPALARASREMILAFRPSVFFRRDAQACKLALLRLDNPHSVAVFGGSPEVPPRCEDLDQALQDAARLPDASQAAREPLVKEPATTTP